jgi:hypothetical protein
VSPLVQGIGGDLMVFASFSTPVQQALPHYLNRPSHHPHNQWFLRGRWRNEHAGAEKVQELNSRSVDVMPGPPVELDASVTRQDDQIRSQAEGNSVNQDAKLFESGQCFH